MRLTLVTPQTAEPLNITEVRQYLRDPPASDDTLIASMIRGAREAFERETGRQLVQATWRGFLDHFPWYRYEPIDVAKPPLVSVASVAYVDTSGVSQVWSPAQYTVKIFSAPDGPRGQIYPGPLNEYPVTLRVPNAVTVDFIAGYGVAANVPEEIKQQLLAWVLDRYDNRDATVIGETPAVIPGRGFGSWIEMGFG